MKLGEEGENTQVNPIQGGEGSGRIPWDSGHVLAFMVVMCDNDDHDVVRVIMMTMVIV